MPNTLVTDKGKAIILDRTYSTTPTYKAVDKFGIGINATAPADTDTDFNEPVPISNGTLVFDGTSNFTGSLAGLNTTTNTTTFKTGAGKVTTGSQNLLKTGTNVLAKYTIGPPTNNFTSANSSFGFWFYVRDSATIVQLAPLYLKVRVGNSSFAYYEWEFNETDYPLQVGWNWLNIFPQALNAGTVVGAPSAPFAFLELELQTDTAFDTFVAGDVMFDVMHEFDSSHMLQDYQAGYPSIGSNNEVTIVGNLSSIHGNGFPIDNTGLFTEDRDLHSVDEIPEIDKYDTDMWEITWRDRII